MYGYSRVIVLPFIKKSPIETRYHYTFTITYNIKIPDLKQLTDNNIIYFL